MKKSITKTLLIMLFLTLAAISWGQSIYYHETFDANAGWTLVPNWSITGGELFLNWSPEVTPYDMAALSPNIVVPANAGDLVISQYINEFTGQGTPPETYEIAVMVGATPTVLWTYATDADWGVTGGQNLTLSLAPFSGQTIQLRFRASGEDTFNFDAWDVYDIKAYASLAHDLAATNLTGSSAPPVNSPSNYILTVVNSGTSTEATYTVKLMKEGDVELASVAGVSLAPGQTHDYTLAWTPTTAGNTFIYGKVVVTDDYAANNQTPNFIVNVQPAGTQLIEIGTGITTQRQPFGVYWGYERDATLFLSSEINLNGALTAVKWYCGSAAAAVVPYKIYMKTTTETAFTAVPWATMIADATQLQEGTYTFSATGWATFTFTNPFAYTGGNLVVMVETSYTGTGVTPYPLFNYSVGAANTHQYWYQDTTAPTGTGSLNTNRPNIGLFFSTVGMGAVTGTVSSSGTPLAGATVNVVGTQLSQITGDNGVYNFPFVAQGNQQVHCTKVGYNPQTLPVVVVENEITTLNFNMIQLPVVTVTGHVVGSDNTSVGLADATIELEGMAPYTATTSATGDFTITGVYTGQTYTYELTKAGYSPLTGSINVGTTNLNMGTLTLNEIALPATTVVAAENAGHTAVNITWSEPGTGGGDWIHYDSGENDDSIGTGAAADFDVAIRYPAAALTDFAGQSLFAIKFYPNEAACTYSLRVWTGGSATAPGTMIVDQAVTPTIADWNIINLTTPVAIPAGQELWFGYRCNTTGGYPAGCDAGPQTAGLGNMIYFDGAWAQLTDLAASLTFNWNIQGWVGYSAPTRNLSATREITYKALDFNANRYNTGTLTTSGKQNTSHNFTNSTSSVRNDRVLTGYKVFRLFEGQETNETAWTTLTPNPITATAYSDGGWGSLADGIYRWAVKAVYTNGVLAPPAFSNSIQRLTQIGTIAGIVRKADNSAIFGATITSGTYTATSNATGAYSMTIPAGTHTVVCSATGFEPSTHTGVVVVTGQTTQVNFVLTPSANVIEESFEGATFPPTGWTQVITNTGAAVNGVLPTWCRVGTVALDPALPPALGEWQAGLWWSETHQEEWLKTPQFMCPAQANVKFNTYAEKGSTHGDHYFLKVSTNGTAWTTLWDATTIPAEAGAFTDYTLPIEISLAAYAGQNIYLAWHADDPTDNLGLWYVWFIDNVIVSGVVANDDPTPIAVVTALNGNYPNPFNPETTISYSVNSKSPVVVEIYNTKGQKVKTLVNETKAAGNWTAKWNGTDDNNQKVSNGVYFYKMNAGKFTSSKKMILMK